MFGGRVQGWQRLARIMSYPPLTTNQFNEDGTETYRSRVMLAVFVPILLSLALVGVLYIYPLFYSLPISSEITEKFMATSRGLQLFANTTTDGLPINPFYAALYYLLDGSDSLIQPHGIAV